MALLIEIKIIPASGKQKCTIDGKTLKCFLKSTPEKGKANAELIKFLSKKLKIAQKNISIVSGGASRKKRIKINEIITFEELSQKLLD